ATPAAPQIGTNVTLTATVGGTAPTGTVQFFDGTTPLGAPVAVSGNQASFSTAGFAAGEHVVTARYSGDGGNAPATSPAFFVAVALAIDPSQGGLDSDGDGLT